MDRVYIINSADVELFIDFAKENGFYYKKNQTFHTGDPIMFNGEELKMEGIVFGFYGDYVNEHGLLLQGYAYKNLDKKQGLELLQKIEDVKAENADYLRENSDNHNIYIAYDDLTILIYRKDQAYKYRVFWNNFDAEWGDFEFKRTKTKFQLKVK